MASPTNADILREVKGVRAKVDDHEERIKLAEHYILTQQAVAEYVKEFGSPAQKEAQQGKAFDAKELASTIGKLMALFSAIVALIYALVIGK